MPYILNKYYHGRDIVFCIGEGLLIFLSIFGMEWLFQSGVFFEITILDQMFRAMVVTIVFQFCLYFFDLYDLRAHISLSHTATRITQAFGVGCIVLGGIYYSLPKMIIPSTTFWAGYAIICILILTWRAIYYFILKKRLFMENIVVLGTGKLAEDISREVEGKHNSSYKIRGFIGNNGDIFNPHGAPIYNSIEELDQLETKRAFDRIIVALDDRRGTTPVKTLLRYKTSGISIEQGVSFYERVTGKLLVENMVPSGIIFSEGFSLKRSQYLMKRGADIVLSLVILILTFPVVAIFALLIKCESRGPLFYSQERVGARNVPFKIYKFRSMRQDAEKDGAVWAQKNDDRVTRIGKIIRKYRIDEIPQLWNVLKGDMSFVGPRPERPVFVEEFSESIPFYPLRHNVKPGITGWAQVCYPYGASREDTLRKLEYDLFYIKNLSLAMDLLVVSMTIKTVLRQKGAR